MSRCTQVISLSMSHLQRDEIELPALYTNARSVSLCRSLHSCHVPGTSSFSHSALAYSDVTACIPH